MFSHNDKELRFLIDHTFFHDVYRDDYHHDQTLWLDSYNTKRYALNSKEKIIIVPSEIINKRQLGSLIYRGIPYSVIQMSVVQLDVFPEIVGINLDEAIIYIAHALLSIEITPIIVSSLNIDKLWRRIKRWAIKQGLEGFNEDMSDNRLKTSFPIKIIDTKQNTTEIKEILSKYDTLYKDVISFMNENTESSSFKSS